MSFFLRVVIFFFFFRNVNEMLKCLDYIKRFMFCCCCYENEALPELMVSLVPFPNITFHPPASVTQFYMAALKHANY